MITHKIAIELVAVVNRNGETVLIGRRPEDRWNLAALGIKYVAHSRNQAAIKKLRRYYGEDFTFATIRNAVRIPADATYRQTYFAGRLNVAA